MDGWMDVWMDGWRKVGGWHADPGGGAGKETKTPLIVRGIFKFSSNDEQWFVIVCKFYFMFI